MLCQTKLYYFIMSFSIFRHASVSSLDESSQKFRSGHNSLVAQIQDNRPLYKNASHPQRAFCQLNGMRDDGMLTDVVLIAAGREVKAHKALLGKD